VTRTEHVDLHHDVEAPRAARRFIGALLTRWAVAIGVIERAQLLVSELVSNAVLYGGGPIRIEVSQAPGVEWVRVEVCNHGMGRPVMRHPDPEELSGRGLQIVDELSDRWGSSAADGQTSVWFEMHAHAHA
jgi:anti-sigma regulatory factor (Ser/Thr protein kinase)